MELNEFISNTLMQIAEGVQLSQKRFAELGGAVNPSHLQQVSGDIPYGKDVAVRGYAKILCNVQFEVSLTSDNTTNTNGGIAVLFGAFSLGGKQGTESKDVALNRVKFNIPIVLPSQR